MELKDGSNRFNLPAHLISFDLKATLLCAKLFHMQNIACIDTMFCDFDASLTFISKVAFKKFFSIETHTEI